MAKRGRKRININWEEFDKLCLIQCTLEEIADWFKCSVDTIENRCKEDKNLKFSEYYKKASVGGKISLRRSQFDVARKGNVSMLIWLGKQHLGQTDSPKELNVAGDIDWKKVGKAFAEAAGKIGTVMPEIKVKPNET